MIFKTSSDFYQGGVIFGCNQPYGYTLPNCTSSDLIFGNPPVETYSETAYHNSGGHCDGGYGGTDGTGRNHNYCFSSSNSWSVPLPENVSAGTYTIPWTYSTAQWGVGSTITPPPMSVTVPTLFDEVEMFNFGRDSETRKLISESHGILRTALNSTGYNHSWTVWTMQGFEHVTPSCQVNGGDRGVIELGSNSPGPNGPLGYQFNYLFPIRHAEPTNIQGDGHTVTCTATDNGLTTKKSFRVTITDPESFAGGHAFDTSDDMMMGNATSSTFSSVFPTSFNAPVPTLAKASNVVVDATVANGAVVKYDMPSEILDLKLSMAPKCNPHSGSFFPIGSTTVTCLAKDSSENQIATAFIVTVKSMMMAPAEIITNVSVTAGKQTYQNNEAIFISGIASPVIDEKVNLEVRDSLSNLVGIEQIDVGESGSYSTVIFPTSLWNTNGTYSMTASYGISQSIENFDFQTFSQSDIQLPSIDVPTLINISPSSDSLNTGETLNILAVVDAGTGHTIVISIEGPGGELLLQPLYTDENGQVNLNYVLPEDLVSGKYTVAARSSGDGYELFKSRNISIIAPVPELTVTDVKTTKENGNDVEKYDAGDLAYFSTNLTAESKTPVLVTVNVFDGLGNTLGVGFFKSTLAEGDSEIVLGFELPSDLVSGVAEIYTNVFTDWPDNGGVPIIDEIKAQVKIIGVESSIEETITEETITEETITEETITEETITEETITEETITEETISKPVLTFDAKYAFNPSLDVGNIDQNFTILRTALNSTGYNYAWHVWVDTGLTPQCFVNLDPVTTQKMLDGNGNPIDEIGPGIVGYQFNHLFFYHTNTVLCQVTDDSGSSTEKSFVVAVLEPVDESFDCTSTSDDRDVEWLEACKPTLTASVYLNSTSPTGRTLDIQTSSDFYQGGVIFGCDGTDRWSSKL